GFAWSDVTPNVTASTATTSSAVARKIFAVSPNAGLVTLASGIGRIVLPVFVVVRLPMVAARVQRDLEVRLRCTGGDVFDNLHWDSLMPDVEAISARGHVVDREAAVTARLREIAVRHHQHVRYHARMHVAVDAHQSRLRESVALCFA